MKNAITPDQVWKAASNKYYRVVEVAATKAKCFPRNGPSGRFSTKTVTVPLKEFGQFELVGKPNLVDNKLGQTHLDWSTEIADSEAVKILKKQNEDLRNKLKKARSGEKFIIDAVRDALHELPPLEIPALPPRSKAGTAEIAVLHISDTQIGKTTPSYDSAVAHTRLLDLVNKTIRITEMRRNAASIDEIRVYLGGDIVEGEDIFPHQAHEIDQSVYDQAVKTAPTILVRCILALLGEFRKVKVVCVPGNHGRNGPRHTGSNQRSNWDSVCYETTKLILMGSDVHPRKELEGRLEFVHKERWYDVDHVFDWGNLIVHGDQITGGFAGFPWYGTAKKAWGWIDSIPAPWDYLWFGHFHTYASATLNHRIFLANGTTESDNIYAQASLAASGYPCQRLAFFNADHGLVSDNPIFLTKDRVPSKVKSVLWHEHANGEI